MIKWIKNKIIYFLIGGVALAYGGSQLPAQVPNVANLQTEYTKSAIQGKYKMENASFIREAKDENSIQIEVGDKTKQKFSPEMNIRKWDNEVSMKVKPKTNSKSKKKDFIIDGEKIKYKEDKKEFHFYEIENGYEVEVILLEKPASNIVEMEIETAGLDFFYQPELTQQEIDDGAFRPENVIGSYAVYHSTKANHILGQKNYMSGKAFHIFRPLIIDSAGKEVWGELNIDEKKGILTVEISQEFLDDAVYPVIVDPTFGEEGIGGTYFDTGATERMTGSLFTSPANMDTVSSISLYGRTGGTSDFKGIVVLQSNLNIINNGIGGATALTGSSAWQISSFGTPPTLSASTDYVIMFSNESYSTTNYDTGSANQGHHDDSNNFTSPTNPIDATTNTDLFSIYATYTAGGGEETPKRIQINTGRININNGSIKIQ